jgi:flagellar assembly protein FliH
MILKGPGVAERTRVVPHSDEGLAPPGKEHGRLSGAAQLRGEVVLQLERARAEAARIVERARAEADRLLGQAQVELGRATAEAEQLVTRAETQLADAGEIITTAAEARQLLAEARAEAEALRAGAEAEAEATLSAAREQGLEEGRQAGHEQGQLAAREELANELELVHGIAAQAKADREEIIAAAEPEIIRLALMVARKIIAREVEADPDILRGLLTRAMLKAAGADPIRLRLHPHAVEVLGPYLLEMASRFAARGVEVVPDPFVDQAGVIVETRTGSVDARTETQLSKIERAMMALAGE